MDFMLNKTFGLIFWTIFNFSILLFLLLKFAVNPIRKALKAREDKINSDIKNAHDNNLAAEATLKEAHEKIANAHKEMSDIIAKGRAQSEEIVRKATEEAENVKRAKVNEAIKEIDRSKDAAIKELRKEMADLVILATSKMINETLDKEKHIKLIDSYIEKLPKN